MRQLTLTLTALSALVFLVACDQASVPSAADPSAGSPAALEDTRTGAVSLRVKWPERTTQYIPETAETIVFGIYKPGITAPLATASLTRPASELSLPRLPIGSLRFTADAQDPDGTVGASGSATVTILPNATVSVPLHLISALPAPTVTGFSPSNGVPGQQVTVSGTNFGASRNTPFAIQYGNTTLPGDRIFRLSDSQLAFFVPTGAVNSTFSVTVGPHTVASTAAFQVIATVSVTPSAVALDASTQQVTLTVTAKDAAGFVIPSPVLPWNTLSENKAGWGTGDPLLFFNGSTRVVSRGTATGSALIGIGLTPTLATVSVTVD